VEEVTEAVAVVAVAVAMEEDDFYEILIKL
jgi:hypothetical protein